MELMVDIVYILYIVSTVYAPELHRKIGFYATDKMSVEIKVCGYC